MKTSAWAAVSGKCGQQDGGRGIQVKQRVLEDEEDEEVGGQQWGSHCYMRGTNSSETALSEVPIWQFHYVQDEESKVTSSTSSRADSI